MHRSHNNLTAFLLGLVAVMTGCYLEDVRENIIEFTYCKGKESKMLGSEVPKVTACRDRLERGSLLITYNVLSISANGLQSLSLWQRLHLPKESYYQHLTIPQASQSPHPGATKWAFTQTNAARRALEVHSGIVPVTPTAVLVLATWGEVSLPSF